MPAAQPEAILASRRALPRPPVAASRAVEAEGGCGVIGIASSEPVAGRHLLQALRQMRNRGNGKGGGIAAVGLDPAFFGVPARVLAEDYLLAIATLDRSVRSHVERNFVEPVFVVDHTAEIPLLAGAQASLGLDVPPPEVTCYFVRVREEARAAFGRAHGIADPAAADDEIVYQNTYRLNRELYASTGEKRAFVLSHGKDMLVLKMVGYGEDVIRAYGLEDFRASIWIGHHRYPTKGKVWHPGGAHPFIGMHEALVHNGDFANYASISSYLAQRQIFPLYLTDTEVAVLAFDLLNRVYGYPLECVIEAMAPTTERDFSLLPADRRDLYRKLSAVHIHGSPDGPWFFLIAQSDPRSRSKRLIGITDTSMLRPQVFAMQRGLTSIGFAASEKQAIDAALESLATEDPRYWSRADLFWNARGGSHTDGGAFTFTVEGHAGNGGTAGPGNGGTLLYCEDKFGKRIEPDATKRAPTGVVKPTGGRGPNPADIVEEIQDPVASFETIRARIPGWDYVEVANLLEELEQAARGGGDRLEVAALLTLLMDRRYSMGAMKRSCVLSMVDRAMLRVLEGARGARTGRCVWFESGAPAKDAEGLDSVAIVDGRGYPAEGPRSLARAIVELHGRGFRRILVFGVRGQRFIGCGLGPEVDGLAIDVYGSSGDYLASGMDGPAIHVHGSAQDQLAQIMKDGTLVVHGDVGQTFMYAAKGGSAFILGNAAGRPMINAVGRPRVVINGTCLDYLAESFMAGDPLSGGGFVILNGITFDEDGTMRDLESPYPGGNLFSLASGGAIYVRDPERKLTDDQLNGGEFAEMAAGDWEVARPFLEENERLFGIPLRALLTVGGRERGPSEVYRKIRPSRHKALLPEEGWVRPEG
jgi:glutamate synthase domain-containing protein 1/glutamate synthase domain-containing protein 3